MGSSLPANAVPGEQDGYVRAVDLACSQFALTDGDRAIARRRAPFTR